MPALNRMMGLRGPKFYVESERIGDDAKGDAVFEHRLVFLNYMDASTRDGPRPATEADAEAHPVAFAAFVAEVEEAEALEARQAQANDREPSASPFRPMLTWSDPPEGKPEPAPPSDVQKRRAAALARGEKA